MYIASKNASFAVVLLTAVNQNVRNEHAVPNKKRLSVVGHKHHIWRRGSSIEHTESTPKGYEGISETISKKTSKAISKEISEAFSGQKIMAISLPLWIMEMQTQDERNG